ncbi:MAG: hypothetical protein JSV58_04685, partial [Candidatus Bathyarchaeota archaeon]
YDQIYVQIRIRMSPDDSFLTDAFLVEEVHQEVQGAPPSVDKNLNCFFPGDYFTDELKTADPSITISGQSFSHIGILEEGQTTAAEPILLPETGVVDITTISVDGSGLVKVKIQATIGVVAEGIFLEAYTDGVYAGHYYDRAYTLTAETQLVAFSDPFSKITIVGVTDTTLEFTVIAESGRTSTIEISCAHRGQPINVSGASSWSYNLTTRIFTVNTIHPNPAAITVEWNNWHGISADLVRRGAWPEHRRFLLSRDGAPTIDDKHGTPGSQTLYAMIRNSGNISIPAETYKVIWSIHSSVAPPSVDETIGRFDLAPGDLLLLTLDIPASDLALGEYHVEAKCSYHYGLESEKTAIFSFTVNP